ncbi:PDC sensor domain-containing protein [Hyalangium versicolor]|uniref:PDC sensor domain-containing protein n=1 Tax=Hyalangium versicolor TaxID=2861190 RepID=UPI001CCD5184|nr:PDC sensor domain-containing protein [Hyalangium versicolor]
MTRWILLSPLMLLTASPHVHAQTPSAHVVQVQGMMEQLRAVTRAPELIQAVRAQNARRLTPGAIQKMDVEWVTSTGIPAFMRPYLEGPCADLLRKTQQQLPAIAEAFVMDNQGALVASTQRTSDYWQGDEDKWQRSFASGAGNEFVDQPEFDESLQAYAVQISLPVMDGGKAIGAVTFGISLDTL